MRQTQARPPVLCRRLLLEPPVFNLRLFCLLVAFTLIIGCARLPLPSIPPSTRDHPGQTWLKTELIFGRSIEGGGSVGDDDWNAFLRTVVTPRFPDGFSVWDATGQWKNDTDDIIVESSKVILIVAPDSEEVSLKMTEIIDIYKSLFRQHSVLRITSDAAVRFD